MLMAVIFFGSNLEAESKFTWTRAVIGGTIGGSIMYFLNMCTEKVRNQEFENKDTFLAELETYLYSDEFKNQKDSTREFNHYYNGLNQLANETAGIGVSLMKDFSVAKDDASRNALIAKVSALASTLKSQHENGLYYSKILMTALGVLSGALIACDDGKGGGNSGSSFFYFPSSSGGSSFFK